MSGQFLDNSDGQDIVSQWIIYSFVKRLPEYLLFVCLNCIVVFTRFSGSDHFLTFSVSSKSRPISITVYAKELRLTC